MQFLLFSDLEGCSLFSALCLKSDSDKPEWIKEEDSRMMIQVGIISDEAQFKDLKITGHEEDQLQVCEGQQQGKANTKCASDFTRTNPEPAGEVTDFGSNVF